MKAERVSPQQEGGNRGKIDPSFQILAISGSRFDQTPSNPCAFWPHRDGSPKVKSWKRACAAAQVTRATG